MAMDVTIQYGRSGIPVSSVLFNKIHFNPIDGHFHPFESMENILRKWPAVGLKWFLLNNTDDTGISEGPYRIVTSMAMG